MCVERPKNKIIPRTEFKGEVNMQQVFQWDPSSYTQYFVGYPTHVVPKTGFTKK